MALSGTQRTRIAVGGPGERYAGFTAKAEDTGGGTSLRGTVGPFTRLAVGGPGLRYAAFIAKGETVAPPTGQVEQSTGGSGKRYDTRNLDLNYWGRKKRKLEAKLKALEKRLQAKREEVNKAPTLEKVQALKKQLAELQKLLLDLLAEIDMAGKEYELEEEKEVVAVYLAYKKRFH